MPDEFVLVPKAEYEWLLWFYSYADFGPADEDVRQSMMRTFESTGLVIPEEYKAE